MSAAGAQPSTPELADVLRPALLRLTRLIRIQRADMSVTLTQLSAMGTLLANGPMSAGELAAAERVQPRVGRIADLDDPHADHCGRTCDRGTS